MVYIPGLRARSRKAREDLVHRGQKGRPMSRTRTHQYRILPLSAPADSGATYTWLFYLSFHWNPGDSTLNQMSGTGRVERSFSREALRWPSPK